MKESDLRLQRLAIAVTVAGLWAAPSTDSVDVRLYCIPCLTFRLEVHLNLVQVVVVVDVARD